MAEEVASIELISDIHNDIMKSFLESSTDAIGITDLNGTIIECNRAAANLSGFTKDELLGKNIFVLYIEEDRPRAIENARRIITQGSLRNVEYTMVTKSGNRIPILVSANVSHDSKGNPKYMVGIFHDLTERKKVETALKESEEKFKKIFEGTAIGIVISNMAGKILMINRAFRNMLGYSEEELLKMNVKDITPAYDLKGENEYIRRASARNTFFVKEKHYIRKDGILILAKVSSSIVKDAVGNDLFTIELIEDITEQKRLELEREVFYQINEALNSNCNLNELFAKVHITLRTVIYAENCFIALNEPETCTIWFPYFIDKFDESPGRQKFGKGLTEYILRTGKALLLNEESFNELSIKENIEIIGAVAKSWLGVPLTVKSETIGVLAVQDYEESGKYSDRDKNLLMIIGSQIALALERKLNDEARQRMEERFQLVWAHSVDGLRLTDAEGKIIMVNDSFCKIFEKPLSELLNNFISSVYSSEYTVENLETYKFKFKNRTFDAHYEKEFLLWNGKKIWLEVSKSFLDSKEQPLLLLSIFRDITQRKRLEMQLLRSQTMESIGRLAGGVAHDFNNMLTAIIGNAEMVSSAYRDDERLNRHIVRIKQAAKRGADLAKQLLTFARLESYDLKPINVNEVLEETIKLIEHTFQKSVEIETNLTWNIPLVNGDPGRLQQVFLNLGVNARDAMPKGGRLTVESSLSYIDEMCYEKPPELASGKYICVKISDTGIGMDEATKLKIFEPFFTTKQQGKGTGLGLAIVYGIVQNHEGFITVESTKNIGTTFKVFLPVANIQNAEHQSTQSENLIEGGAETILVVDDEEIVLEIAREILTGLNYKVIAVNNGFAAIELYKINRQQISLVMLDLAMPRMNGEETFKRLKEINPDVKVIVASGLIDSDTRERMFKNGTIAFLNKPYNVNEIAAAIRYVLELK